MLNESVISIVSMLGTLRTLTRDNALSMGSFRICTSSWSNNSASSCPTRTTRCFGVSWELREVQIETILGAAVCQACSKIVELVIQWEEGRGIFRKPRHIGHMIDRESASNLRWPFLSLLDCNVRGHPAACSCNNSFSWDNIRYTYTCSSRTDAACCFQRRPDQYPWCTELFNEPWSLYQRIPAENIQCLYTVDDYIPVSRGHIPCSDTGRCANC